VAGQVEPKPTTIQPGLPRRSRKTKPYPFSVFPSISPPGESAIFGESTQDLENKAVTERFISGFVFEAEIWCHNPDVVSNAVNVWEPEFTRLSMYLILGKWAIVKYDGPLI
jgi:hypothetical protein